MNVALRVLDKLRLNIPVCGMVKDDSHRTRGCITRMRKSALTRILRVLS